MLPVIQGYVQMEACVMDFAEDKHNGNGQDSDHNPGDGLHNRLEPLKYNISIISRRSRHRAGQYVQILQLNGKQCFCLWVFQSQLVIQQFLYKLISRLFFH